MCWLTMATRVGGDFGQSCSGCRVGDGTRAIKADWGKGFFGSTPDCLVISESTRVAHSTAKEKVEKDYGIPIGKDMGVK